MSVITQFTLDQYQRMIGAGVFDEAEYRRLELLRGEIVPMSPIGVPHFRMVNILNRWSTNCTSSDEAEVSVQNPIFVPPNQSAPEPDLAWLRARDYTGYPLPEDVLLVIEVADTTLRKDTGLKAAIYAEGGIADYWVVDLVGEVILVHRDPRGGDYRAITTAHGDDEIYPLSHPGAVLNVGETFDKIESIKVTS